MAAVLIALGACGRVDFDPHVDAARADASNADTAASCAPLPCASASAFVMCGSWCFAICEDIVDWQTAQQRCVDWGGTLATIPSPTEMACLSSLSTLQLWMGYVQIDNASAMDAGWSWLDGTASGYVNWASGEPNDGEDTEDNTEQCGELYPGAGWNDERCTINNEDGIACSK